MVSSLPTKTLEGRSQLRRLAFSREKTTVSLFRDVEYTVAKLMVDFLTLKGPG